MLMRNIKYFSRLRTLRLGYQNLVEQLFSVKFQSLSLQVIPCSLVEVTGRSLVVWKEPSVFLWFIWHILFRSVLLSSSSLVTGSWVTLNESSVAKPYYMVLSFFSAHLNADSMDNFISWTDNALYNQSVVKSQKLCQGKV